MDFEGISREKTGIDIELEEKALELKKILEEGKKGGTLEQMKQIIEGQIKEFEDIIGMFERMMNNKESEENKRKYEKEIEPLRKKIEMLKNSLEEN